MRSRSRRSRRGRRLAVPAPQARLGQGARQLARRDRARMPVRRGHRDFRWDRPLPRLEAPILAGVRDRFPILGFGGALYSLIIQTGAAEGNPIPKINAGAAARRKPNDEPRDRLADHWVPHHRGRDGYRLVCDRARRGACSRDRPRRRPRLGDRGSERGRAGWFRPAPSTFERIARSDGRGFFAKLLVLVVGFG